VVIQFFEQLPASLGKGFDVDWNVGVGANEGGCRRKVIDDSTPSAPLGSLLALLFPLHLQFTPIGRRRQPAPLRGDTGHARAAEGIQNNVTRFRVMQDGRNDGQMRHLGVIRVSSVKRIGFSYSNIDSLRLSA